ncbi:11992_t:CDS:2 [Ambispora gerdemannii]|uniref:11992_t:CDS:1 n=1 Tax=Ambispora gerdemannii TaxID=144530 RepID=A0A9N8W2T1_9GLOM|nr:11992_t:CDS:2 [Ambispora gerdemannii]
MKLFRAETEKTTCCSQSGANTGFVLTLQSKDTAHVVDATASSLKRTSEPTPVDKSSYKS